MVWKASLGAISAAALASQAYAADRLFVNVDQARNGSVSVFVDVLSVERLPPQYGSTYGNVVFWELVVYPPRTRPAYALERYENDCRAHTTRLLDGLYYAEDGTPTGDASPELSPTPNYPESVGESVENLVCGQNPQTATPIPNGYKGALINDAVGFGQASLAPATKTPAPEEVLGAIPPVQRHLAARCKDGSYQDRIKGRHTCGKRGGVQEWFDSRSDEKLEEKLLAVSPKP